VFGAILDGLEDILACFFTKAGEGGDAAILAGRLELGDGGDAELLPEDLDFFWAEALQLEDLEKAGRKLGAQGGEEGDLPGLAKFGDLVGQSFADAGDGGERALLHALGKIAGVGLESARRVGVGANLE